MRRLTLLLFVACGNELARVPPTPADGASRVTFVADVGAPFRIDEVIVSIDGARVTGNGEPLTLRDGVHVVAANVLLSLPCTLGDEPREKIRLRKVRYIDTRGAFEARFALETLGAPLAAFEQRPVLGLAVAGATVLPVAPVKGESLPISEACQSAGGATRFVCAAKEEMEAAQRVGDAVASECAQRRFAEMTEALSQPESDAAIAKLADRVCIAHDPIQPGDAREIAACPLPDLPR